MDMRAADHRTVLRQSTQALMWSFGTSLQTGLTSADVDKESPSGVTLENGFR